MSKMDKMILCLKESTFTDNAYGKVKDKGGFLHRLDASFLASLCDDILYPSEQLTINAFSFVRRGDAENDPTWKQIIPYILLKNSEGQYFVYSRHNPGDARLKDKFSLGIGGHIDQDKGNDLSNITATILNAAKRELNEEVENAHLLNIPAIAIGTIYDDKDEVGRVHIGLVFVIDVGDQDIKIKEKDVLTNRGFYSKEEINSLIEFGADFEGWSRILIQNLPL